MLSPRLRERLSRLLRASGSPEAPPAAPAQTVSDRPAPPPGAAPTPAAQPWRLAYELPGDGVQLEGATGACLLIQPDLEPLLPDLDVRVKDWMELPAGEWGLPERRLLLDIETAGLAAAPLFLIGTLALEGGTLRLRQFLARDYTEEPAILSHFFDRIPPYESLVTFNGQSFDVPYLLDRAFFHRCPGRFPPAHVDLIAPARQRWRGRFADCRLATLETHVCGRRRIGDVAGADIPQLYHDFVRTGHWDLLAPVLFHNALDLLTMAELASHL